MRKKVVAIVKLQIPAGKATPAPPVGPALGQHGVNIMEFVKTYNERTARQAGTIVPVEITIYADRTFTFVTKTPPAAVVLTQAAGREEGAGAATGKGYRSASKLIDRTRLYPPEEAVKLLKQTAQAKFAETVEAHVRLGGDPKHADQQGRGTGGPPAGAGAAR